MLLEEIGSGRSDCGWKAARAEASLTAQIQMALDAWVSERATSEKMTGAAAYISFGEPGPAIEVFAEKVGAGPQDPPVRQNTLFQRILRITLQTNSQPAADRDQLNVLLGTIYQIVKSKAN